MSTRERFDRWKQLMQPQLAMLRARAFRPTRTRAIETLAAMTEVELRWLQGECERTSFEGMLHTLGVVTDRTRGAEYWERLCANKVIPLAWLDDPERVFFERPCDPVITDLPVYEPDRAWRSTPVRALDALTIAGDPAGVAAVEALARECAARFGVLDAGSTLRMHWSVLRNGGSTERTSLPDATALPASIPGGIGKPAAQLGERWTQKLEKLLDLNDPALLPLLNNDNTRARTSRWYLRRALEQVAHDAAWRLLASEGAAIAEPETGGSMRALFESWIESPRRTYASAPNPFEPMVAILERGYFLEAIKREGVWLYAPSL